MTDIVEQTLNEQHDVYAKAREEYRKVIQQQRDEIERLREAFQNYMDHVGCGTAIRCEHCDAARAALKEKE